MTWDADTRLAAAAFAVVAYLAMCSAIWRARRQARRARLLAAQPSASGPQSWLVVYASQTGFAEQLAKTTLSVLHAGGVPAQLCVLADLTCERLVASQRALFVVSSYGEGGPPDNGAAFVAKVMTRTMPSLAALHFGVLMLGDSRYPQFCGFGHELTGWLKAHGAQALFDSVAVDGGGDTRAPLAQWQQHLSHIAGTHDAPDWEGPPWQQWTLTARRCLNPGSHGSPAFHLELQPRQNAGDGTDNSADSGTAALPHWEAGDLVQVLALADPTRPRDYSIASIPADGALHLLVRQERRPDGTLGAASGWLTHDAPLGAVVELRLRAHANFRLGENATRPLILIGNGTGLAGLRSHLKARAAAAARGHPTRNWLVFGERNAAHDCFHQTDLDHWQQTGVLERTDLVFSRDAADADNTQSHDTDTPSAPSREYVQHRLLARAEQVRAWLADGAAVYVCGSLQGMAAGVDAALKQIAGENGIARLLAEGRYRRDVY